MVGALKPLLPYKPYFYVSAINDGTEQESGISHLTRKYGGLNNQETYVGGHVEALSRSISRANLLPCR
ncbi:hypothetical protein NPIL_610961 [Nephila pilipes]|uniref:Uncharacterized protein n=1 Tax=Nephila pilipes TaxID=299642 RepID=A0A8X6QTM3_NEPPI|nr:hypothetical protein NPIL_610961 [Nephila pilipes]